ncbi:MULTISPECIES: putative phage tail assembly chaperone [Enterobacteriaceae]|nr:MULTISPECIES: putative phage tail assembly chaperone [Enterobacteriaceae]MDS1455905.1 putative phage tail assembly chaperone [Escherichia coli]
MAPLTGENSMKDENTTIITLTVAGEDIRFAPTEAVYNKFVNEITMDNKVAPAKNYLMRCVHPEDKEKLEKLIHRPGAALQMAAKLNEDFAVNLDITVKK